MSAARIFPFRQAKSGTPGVSAQSLGIPAAAYPGRIATNSDLIVAVDRQQTTLLLPMGASDTSMTVLDASMIAAYNLQSIDNEIVKTTGPPAGNVVPVARGFDGTTPAAHLAGAPVSGLVDAYHHNALVAEIEAIEQALGPNLGNIPTSGAVNSVNYSFPAQSPGGNLIIGANTITLSPVPKGVNGTDQNHWMLISGGTGTLEAVPISGGTAVSGATSGTIIVTCASTHSGAWAISSASVGIQEALQANGAYARVSCPAGLQSLYGPIFLTADYQAVCGAGNTPTTFFVRHAGTAFSSIAFQGTMFRDFSASYVVTPGSGSAGIYQIKGANCKVQNVTVSNAYVGMNFLAWDLSDLSAGGMTQGEVESCWIVNPIGNGLIPAYQSFTDVHFTCSQPASAAVAINMLWADGTEFQGINILGSFLNGLLINPVASSGHSGVFNCKFVNMIIDTFQDRGIWITGVDSAPSVSPAIYGLDFVSCHVGTQLATSPGTAVEIDKGSQIHFTALKVAQVEQSGIVISGVNTTGITFDACYVIGASQQVAGGFYGCEINGGSNVAIRNSTIGDMEVLGQTNRMAAAVHVGNGVAVNGLVMTGCSMNGNNGAVFSMGAGATIASAVIRDNFAIDNAFGTLAAAAAITVSPNFNKYYITGNTPAIATINGGWPGSRIELIFTGTAPTGVAAGGNIGRTQAAAQYQTLALTWDGTRWQ